VAGGADQPDRLVGVVASTRHQREPGDRALRAERFDERTAANVATAGTSVPPAGVSDEIVARSAIRRR